MKCVILAGGLGTRLSEETNLKPKPMVEIGNMPIIWHIMKHLSFYGVKEFIICGGYKSQTLKEFFMNYHIHNSEITVKVRSGEVMVKESNVEDWEVTIIDSGVDTGTGGRILSAAHQLGDKPFLLTYGDGLSDVNITELISFHKKWGLPATVTTVQPKGRYGRMKIAGNVVQSFSEKTDNIDTWINGGFFILEPEVLSLISDKKDSWEEEPMKILASTGKLAAFKHFGFWQSMDTLREKNLLEELWNNGNAPWKVW